MIEILKKLSPLGTLIATAFALYFWADGRYAHEEALRFLQNRFEVKVTSDYLQNTQQRLWALEDKIAMRPNDQSAKDEKRRLDEDKKKYEAELVSLKSKLTK